MLAAMLRCASLNSSKNPLEKTLRSFQSSFGPGIQVLVADIAHFERHVAADRPLHANRVGVHPWGFQVAILREDVDAVRRRCGDRVDRRGREGRRSEPGALAEEHRSALARQDEGVAGAEIARDADRPTGVAARVGGEAVDALLVVAQRVAAADRRLLRVAEQRPQPARSRRSAATRPRRSGRNRTSSSCAPAAPGSKGS